MRREERQAIVKKSHYEILGVGGSAGRGEIKASFRRLAKKYHPDRNGGRVKWAAAHMRRVIEAYETLADDARRGLYDRKRRLTAERERDYYREMLVRSRHKPESRAALILYDLLTGKSREAMLYFEEEQEKGSRFDPCEWLSAKDGLDCKFLLAEEYERANLLESAFDLYESVYHHECAERHFGSFIWEVRDRIRNLCCRGLARSRPPGQAVAYYRRLLQIKLPRMERAFIHKKIAESFQRIGSREDAMAELRRAFELKPGLKGVGKICSWLGMTPPAP